MAKNKKPTKGKSPDFVEENQQSKIAIDYFHLYESLYRKEIDDWISARTIRRDPFHPTTYAMQQLYKDALLDNHLSGAIKNQRILPILNKEFSLRNGSGEVDIDRSKLVQTKWFRDIIREALWSIFYGYSLIFVDRLNMPDRTIINVNRENVIPELGVISKNPLVPSGEHINYKDFPAWFLFASLGDNTIGMLESIAPLTIYKRHSWASWDEFEQIFGLPLRIARTVNTTQSHINELQTWLETMGSASYGIFDKQTDLEIHESSQKDSYHIYLEKINVINSEISKSVLGQTMTIDNGSSLSQSETHKNILDEIHKSDAVEIEEWVNDTLLPVLRVNGFDIPEDYTFAMQDHEIIAPRDKIMIDQVLLNAGYNIDQKYIEQYYSTPLDKTNPKKDMQPSLSLSATDFFA